MKDVHTENQAKRPGPISCEESQERCTTSAYPQTFDEFDRREHEERELEKE